MLKVNPPPLTFVVLKLMLKFKLTDSKLKQTAFKRNNTKDSNKLNFKKAFFKVYKIILIFKG